jgi:hypothetical protein
MWRNTVMDNYVPRLKKVYKDTIAPELVKEFGYKSSMQIPALKKIVVSMGVGEALTNKKLLDAAVYRSYSDHRTARGQDEGSQKHS